MAQHFEGDTKKFTITAFSSFATIFCIVMLFMHCHGDYTPKTGGHGAGAEKHAAPHATGSSEHNTNMNPADTTHTGGETHADTTHKDGAHH